MADLKRHVVTMRMSDSARSRINEAAEANGRSVSQEIESRLEMSFQEERLLGGSNSALLSRLIAGTISLIEIETGKSWFEDRMSWESARSAMTSILEWFQPSIDPDIWREHQELFYEFLDAVVALAAIRSKIEGLGKAYPFITDFTPDALEEFEQAKAAQLPALKEVIAQAKPLYDGPLKIHNARKKEAEALGRELAATRATKHRGNFIVGGVMKMFRATGSFEPLPSLVPAPPLSEDEIFEFARRLASMPLEDANSGNPQA